MTVIYCTGSICIRISPKPKGFVAFLNSIGFQRFLSVIINKYCLLLPDFILQYNYFIIGEISISKNLDDNLVISLK